MWKKGSRSLKKGLQALQRLSTKKVEQPADEKYKNFIVPKLKKQFPETKEQDLETEWLSFVYDTLYLRDYMPLKNELLSKDNPQGKTWNVKLILTQLTNVPKPFKIFGKVATHLGLCDFPYGFVHTALQIGPYILDWNDSSLVIPYPLAGNEDALFAIDLEWLPDSTSVDLVMLTNLAICSIEWMTTRTYDIKDCNCQHFVDALLQVLDIELNFNGEAKNFMEKIQKAVDPSFRFKYKDQEFGNHQALDTFLAQIDVPSLDLEDQKLLKAYDRAFWLRYYAIKSEKTNLTEIDIKKYKSDSVCYFGDPSTTGTFVGPTV